MINIYISKYDDVYTNIAIERYLFKNYSKDLTLFLWSNNPCVVIGRNQNIYNEVNLEYANEKCIDIIRRFSGGGAVYQDNGNLNYTFISNEDKDMNLLNEMLIKVFNNLNLNVSFSGRNDLVIDDKKFSGIAYCNDFNHLMYHGTCLININKDELTKVLKPHDYKLKSHSVNSYKSRVINLKEIKNISKQDVIDSFINVLKKEDSVNLQEIIINDEIQEIINQLKNKDYIYNDCPGYLYSLDIKLNNANYHFDLEYKNGIIIKIDIYSDDLDNNKKQYYYDQLINKKVEINNISDFLNNLK